MLILALPLRPRALRSLFLILTEVKLMRKNAIELLIYAKKKMNTAILINGLYHPLKWHYSRMWK